MAERLQHDAWGHPVPEGPGALLARIDERTKTLSDDVAEIKRTMVTSKEFAPFKVGIFAVIGSIVTAFGSAVYAAIFHVKGSP